MDEIEGGKVNKKNMQNKINIEIKRIRTKFNIKTNSH
jgi:hypothetical protein